MADAATYRALERFLFDRVDRSLAAVDRGVNGGGPPFGGGSGDGAGGPRFGPGGPGPGDIPNIAAGTYVERRDSSGHEIFTPVPARLPGGEELTPKIPSNVSSRVKVIGSSAYFFAPSKQTAGPTFRVRASRATDGDLVIAAVPLGDTFGTLHRLLAIEIAVTLAALAAALAAGWWVVRLGLRPLRDVEHTATAIASGEFDRRVPGDDARTEVGEVARALNTMLSRIAEAFAQRDATEAHLRRFVADASHELRTPLAAVSAYAEMLDHPSAPAEDVTRARHGIRTETSRMERLVEDLLLLARLDEGQPLERKPLDIVAIVGEAVDTAKAVGPAWPVQLVASEPLEITGDALRLRQVFDNLLANVRSHTPAGTPTTIEIARSDNDAVISVADRGPGLQGDDAERIFERFFRADPSRSRQHGGSGLGLGIVAAIVGAHGGRVEASPTLGGGTTITVRLPLSS